MRSPKSLTSIFITSVWYWSATNDYYHWSKCQWYQVFKYWLQALHHPILEMLVSFLGMSDMNLWHCTLLRAWSPIFSILSFSFASNRRWSHGSLWWVCINSLYSPAEQSYQTCHGHTLMTEGLTTNPPNYLEMFKSLVVMFLCVFVCYYSITNA